MEMWFYKSYSKKKLFELYLTSQLLSDFTSSTLLHVENCCTIADKIYPKAEASLIQFSWNLYSILYHNSRACIPNFKPIKIDLITKTQTWSQLTQIFNNGQISITWAILHQIESNLKSTCLNTFTRHKFIQSTY